MKSFFATVVVLVAVLVLGAGIAGAAISGSKHDFVGGPTATNAAAISSCGYCHTPHNSNTGLSAAPLWNRTATNQSYTLYSSNTFTSASMGQPGANSKTCLSCHDGTVSIGDTYSGTNALSGWTGSAVGATGLITSAANLGTSLANDHPIGFNVDTTKAGLDSIANMQADGAKFYGASNTMECASCHDPHGVGTYTKFLRLNPITICSDCHASK